jgi:DNA-binding NarL/FixJ family response regulator
MTLSDADRAAVLQTLTAKRPEIIQARMANALLLLADGLSVEDVAGQLYLEESSVAGWKAMYSKRKPKVG